ncbi:hypothetical protein ACF0H5_021023 [Mactra antiquata]
MILFTGHFVFIVILWLRGSATEAKMFYHFSKWIKTPKSKDTGVYVFDWRLRLSVTQCMKVCNETKACQFFNYESRPHLCGLIRTDEHSKVEVEQKPGYVYGNKSEWTKNDVSRCNDCDLTGRCNNNDLLSKKNEVCRNSGCEAPSGEDFLGNMFSTGSKIKSNCKDGYTKLPIGLTIDHQTCAENGSWGPHACLKTKQYGESYYYLNPAMYTWNKAKVDTYMIPIHKMC